MMIGEASPNSETERERATDRLPAFLFLKYSTSSSLKKFRAVWFFLFLHHSYYSSLAQFSSFFTRSLSLKILQLPTPYSPPVWHRHLGHVCFSVKYFSSVKYFQIKIFLGNENIFKCLVSFQKMLYKIFSDVWLYSWKYYKKHTFYLLLTFSQLPNKYIISFLNR